MPTIQSTKHFTCRQAHPTPLPILLFKTRTLTLLPLLLFKNRAPCPSLVPSRDSDSPVQFPFLFFQQQPTEHCMVEMVARV